MTDKPVSDKDRAIEMAVDARLVRWARWAARLEDMGLGYQSRAAWFNLGSTQYRGTVSMIKPEDEDALETEACIRQLPEQEQSAILIHYRAQGLVIEKVRRHRIDIKTFYRRLHSAYRLMYTYLNNQTVNQGCT